MNDLLASLSPADELRVWDLALSKRYSHLGENVLASLITMRGIDALENDPAYRTEREQLLKHGPHVCALSGNFFVERES